MKPSPGSAISYTVTLRYLNSTRIFALTTADTHFQR
jgi:hypothetical protein